MAPRSSFRLLTSFERLRAEGTTGELLFAYTVCWTAAEMVAYGLYRSRRRERKAALAAMQAMHCKRVDQLSCACVCASALRWVHATAQKQHHQKPHCERCEA